MKKHGMGKKLLAALLALAMVLPMMPLRVFAAVGDKQNGNTGLQNGINTGDTIKLPIKIYDYLNDGMLFEYAENNVSKTEFYRPANWKDYKPTVALGSVFTKADTSEGMYSYYHSNASGYGPTSYIRDDELGHYLFLNLGNRNTSMPKLLSEFPGGISKNSVRYVVVVYRGWQYATDLQQITFYPNADRTVQNGWTTASKNVYMNHDWKAGVFDLKTGTLGGNWGSITNINAIYANWPCDGGTSGNYNNKGVDVLYAAYFSNQTDAESFAKQATNYTGTWYQMHGAGDNRGFGLLRASRNSYYQDTIDATTGFSGNTTDYPTIFQINTYEDHLDVDLDTYGDSLGYPLHGVFGGDGIATLGLLEQQLVNGLPVYKEDTVDYVAQLLQKSLTISYNSAEGYRSYSYVDGAPSERYGGVDLATWLRKHITGEGSYADSKTKQLVGTWDECKNNIKTYYDAAYFLLNSIFVAGSYNTPMNDYNYLVLSKGTATDGRETYIFDAGFSDNAGKCSVQYDSANGTIRNTSAAGKTEFCYQEWKDSSGTTQQSWTTFYPFLPIVDGSGNNTNGVTTTPYFKDPGVQETNPNLGNYVNRNFNFALVSEGEFVYHEEDNLFFDFEGDDDVYLFINNKLVMDIGGAHSISKETIELNDYKNDLDLKDGEVYSFKFFYLERHGYGANMRINTNIRVTDPKMTTDKTAYQSGSQVEYGGVVDKTLPVEYGFAMTNNGNVNLYNLTFTDNTIGIKLDPTNGLNVTSERVCDVNGEKLDVTDLVAYVDGFDKTTGAKLDTITVKFANETELKNFLTSLTSDSVVETGAGLWPRSTVTIRGFAYRLTEAQIQAGVFDNVVDTTATPGITGTPLTGQDQMRVFVPSDPMYYQWANHALSITKEKLVADVLAAAKQEGNALAGKVPNLRADNVTKIEEVLSNGNTTDYEHVSISGNNLTVHYPQPGSYLFRVKISYDTNQSVVVPVLVNVADVKDSVFVLDYGLTAELTQNNELFKDDSLNVPGRDNTHSMLGVGNTQPSYNPNNISFAAASGNTLNGLYGTYTLTDGATLKYKPTKFMEGLDTMWLAVDVRESGTNASAIGNVNINKEVQMYKSVTVLPATVVYYEDDFPAIKYETVPENTITPLGSSSDKTQSVDQSEQYGHDAAYADGSNTEMSGGSLHTIAINNSGVVASFTFKGTGFELIARTNATDSATISVKVYDKNNNLVKNIPVITEFDNGANGGEEAIYQVPIIRVDDLALGQYTVKISGVPARDYDHLDADGNPTIKTTYLYLDGLRIFQPMGATNEHYSKEENGATFAEIRDLIVNGTVAAAEFNGETVDVSTGTVTWTENLNGTTYGGAAYTGNKVESVNDYLTKGPNNEVYMNGDTTDPALVFYVKKTDGGVHNLQIAVHAVDAGLFTGTNSTGMNAELQVGIAKDGTYAWTPLATVTSATEQYYTIDLTDCPTDGQGRIQIAVKVKSGMVSFTSLKYNGLTIESIGGPATTLYYKDGILTEKTTAPDTGEETENQVDPANYANFASVSQQMRATAVVMSADEIDAAPADTEEPATEEPTTEETTPEEPATEEPATEEPATEEPATEEPVTEEPTTEESGNTGGNTSGSRTAIIKLLLKFLKKIWG